MEIAISVINVVSGTSTGSSSFLNLASHIDPAEGKNSLDLLGNARHALPGVSFSRLIDDLTDIIFRAPAMTNINAAIKCLATAINQVTGDASKFMFIGKKCFNAVHGIAATALKACTSRVDGLKDKVALSGPHLAQLQRALIILGALCEHSKLCLPQLLRLGLSSSNGAGEEINEALSAASSGDEEELYASLRSLEESAAQSHILNTSVTMTALTINGSCYRAATFALQVDDIGVQTRAVQALCMTFIGCPRLVFAARNSGLFASLLDPKQHPDIFVEKFVSGMNNVMVVDERRAHRAHYQHKFHQEQHTARVKKQSTTSNSTIEGRTKGKGLDVVAMMMADDNSESEEEEEMWSDVGQSVLTASAQDSDISAPGAVCVQHKDCLLELMAHRDFWIRLASLRLVSTLLRQGILCPLDAVGSLVCMQSDLDHSLRQESLDILVQGDAKHPTFLDNRVVDGLVRAFEVQANQVRERELLGRVILQRTSGRLPHRLSLQQTSVQLSRRNSLLLLARNSAARPPTNRLCTSRAYLVTYTSAAFNKVESVAIKSFF